MTSPESHLDDDDFDQNDTCANCGGEGVVYDCFDGFCENAEEGCEDCARRCDWCNRPSPKQIGGADHFAGVGKKGER